LNSIDYHDVFGYSAGILLIVGMFPYVRSIIKTKKEGEEKTELNRASWLIWMAIGIINLFAYFSAGEKETIWFVVVGALNPTILFVLSLKFGEKHWYGLDTVCLVLAIVALILWKTTGNPVLALAACLSADALAIIPTFIKVRNKPLSENLTGWFIGLLASFSNMMAVKEWTWTNGIYTLYMVVGFLSIVWAIVLTRWQKRISII